MIDYVEAAIASFVNDPADSDFQRGYLAAMEKIADIISRDPIRASEYVRLTMHSFEDYPADNDYQHGYLSAMSELFEQPIPTIH